MQSLRKLLGWSKINKYFGGEDGPVFLREDQFLGGGKKTWHSPAN
jgi:hypothetical protein